MTHCLLTLIFIIPRVYFLLLQVSASDRNWFPCSNFPCILCWVSAFGFIASVRCVEWANCSFWVIIAALFVCLLVVRDDLCPALPCRPVTLAPTTAVVFFCPGPRSTSALEGKSLLLTIPHPDSPVPMRCPRCLAVVTMSEVSDRNHLLWDEGGHSLATIVYVWPVGAPAAALVVTRTWRGTEPDWVTPRTRAGSPLPAMPGLQSLAPALVSPHCQQVSPHPAATRHATRKDLSMGLVSKKFSGGGWVYGEA